MWDVQAKLQQLQAELDAMRLERDQLRAALRDMVEQDRKRRENAEREIVRLLTIAAASNRIL